MELTRSQKFIEENKRVLKSSPEYFNVDTNYQKREEFDKAKVKMLLCFPSPASNKAVSMTAAVFNDYVQESCPGVFIDFCYAPEPEDLKLYDKNNMPYLIGVITHLDASHFDYVGFSISILFESLGAAWLLKSCSRCDKPIPLTWSERKDKKLGECPVVMAGGITASTTDILFGDLGDGRQAFLDTLYLGECHRYNEIFEMFPRHKENGYTIQDHIDAMWEEKNLDFIYQPQAYEVKFNDRNQIVSNIKINPKAPDMCRPYYPDKMPKELGSALGIIVGDGGNVDMAQIQAANGCSRTGACNFCHEGWYTGGWVENTKERLIELAEKAHRTTAGSKLKMYSFNCVHESTPIPTADGKFVRASELKDQHLFKVYGSGPHQRVNKFEDANTFSIECNQGSGIILTPNHRQTILGNEGLEEVKANQLKVGDLIPQRIGVFKHLAQKAEYNKWYVLGLFYGDGHFSGNSTLVLVNKNESKIAEAIKPFVQRVTYSKDSVDAWLLSKDMTKLIREYFPNHKDDISQLYRLSIPEWISFLNGYFDADGCGHSGFLKITSTNSRLEMLRLCSSVLASIGVRTRISKVVPVTLKKTGKTYYRRDLYIIGQESRQVVKDLFLNTSGKLDLLRTDYYKGCRDHAIPAKFGKWVYSELVKNNISTTGYNCSSFFRGKAGMSVEIFTRLFGNLDIEPVRLINSGIRFTKITDIYDYGKSNVVDVTEMEDGRWLAGTYITHNTNYLSDYPNLIWTMMHIFPEVSFNNMRLEELGKDVDNIKMMKLAGFQRTAAPIEGISPRIRNGLLNKNLSEESLDAFLSFVMYMGAIDVKAGIVYTGYETDEDWQWLLDFTKKWKEKCRITGGNLPIRFKPTPMVHYAGTPIEYIERKAPKHSWSGEHWIPDKWNDEFYQKGFRIKMNGFRYSCFIEQAVIDLGRSATQWMWENLTSKEIPIYNFRPLAKEEILTSLKALVNYDYFFNERDPEKYISVGHRIHLAMHAAMIYQAKNILKNGVNAKPVTRCLKTYEGCKVECKKYVYKDNPIKFYSDAYIGEDGKVTGKVWEEVEGCNGCKTEEMRKFVLTRPNPKTKTSEDLFAYKGKPVRSRLRFKINRQPGYEVLSPRNTAFTSISKFLMESEEVYRAFYKVMINHNMYWQSDTEYCYLVDGAQYVDVTFTEDVLDKVQELVPVINEKSKSFQVEWVKSVDLKDDIKVSDWNIFKFESTIPAEIWQYCTMQYDGEIRVMKDDVFSIEKDSQLIKPSFSFKSKVEGYFAVPCKYSPIHYLQGLLSSKRINLNKILATTKIHCVSTVRESNMVCFCNDGKTVVDLGLNKQYPVCKSCMIKLLTKKL